MTKSHWVVGDEMVTLNRRAKSLQPPIAKPNVSHSEANIEAVLLEMWMWQRAQISDLLKVLRKLKEPK